MQFQNDNDTSNIRDNWKNMKIIQKIRTSNTPGKHDIKELQKTAILGTEHIVRKILMSR